MSAEPRGLTDLERALMSARTDALFREYENWLGFSLSELGHRVLDLGSGEHETFSKEARRRGITVDSMNPKLLIVQDRFEAKSSARRLGDKGSGWQRRSFAGLGQRIPVKEGTYDSVVANWSVPYYLDQQDWPTALSEVYRVLKRGGRVFMAPFEESQLDYIQQQLNELGFIEVEVGEVSDEATFYKSFHAAPYYRIKFRKP